MTILDVQISNQGHLFLDFQDHKALTAVREDFESAGWDTWVIVNPREAQIRFGSGTIRLGAKFYPEEASIRDCPQ